MSTKNWKYVQYLILHDSIFLCSDLQINITENYTYISKILEIFAELNIIRQYFCDRGSKSQRNYTCVPNILEIFTVLNIISHYFFVTVMALKVICRFKSQSSFTYVHQNIGTFAVLNVQDSIFVTVDQNHRETIHMFPIYTKHLQY